MGRSAGQPQRVVGVGASAGGLEPLRQLLAALPTNTGLSVVVLQHLPPAQTDHLAQALASATSLPIINAVDGHRVARDTVVVVPPRTSAALVRGVLMLRVPRGGSRPRQPIDGLFTSLATALGARAVGIVLSGAASDGAAGLRAIREAGGIAIAQDPSTAQFDEMPRSAIAAGAAELVLAPSAIGERLAEVAGNPSQREMTVAHQDGITRVLQVLREASGIDFTSYKRSTIERRLARAMSHHRALSPAEYAAFLEKHPDEVRSLYEDLLIHVTEFFRDGSTLEVACSHLVKLVSTTASDAPVRVWVPGCSTGEEVYSLTMLLIEQLGEHRPLQLFGTDLSERAIELARRGRYPAGIAKQVGAERLARFFVRDEHGYRIRREVRERCVFVRHDLVTDPPFSKLDLISCRNVLIYLGPELQHRVIPMFHSSLNQPGLLVLGRAESIAGFDVFFEPVDTSVRLFARKPRPRALMTFPGAGQLGRLPARRPEDPARSKLAVQRDVDQLLLARYAPACVVVDEHLDVVQFRGRTSAYLEQPPGQPQLNVLRLARGELVPELRMALQRAQLSGVPVRKCDLRLRDRGRPRYVDLEVLPVPATDLQDRHFAIVFEDRPPHLPAPAKRPRGGKRPREDKEVAQLHQELDASREYVRSITAQHLAASEELGLVNEELQSTNEELQSSNEELQTSKEELQSANEELVTVNEELQRSNAQLRESNDDLVNVLASIDIAIIIVDTGRCVRRFTPKARAVIKLLPGDVGRPIADLQAIIPAAELDAAISNVIDTLAVHEAEVRAADSAYYRLQIRPYRTADDRIDGAVLAFVDVTTLRNSIEATRAAHDFADTIVQTVPTPLCVIDDKLYVLTTNRAFALAFESCGELLDRPLLELGAWHGVELHDRLRDVFSSGAPITDLEVEHRNAEHESRTYLVAAMPISAGGQRLVLLGLADVTERRRLEAVRRGAERQRDAFIAALSDELRMPLSAILLWTEVLRGLEPGDPQRQIAIDTIADSARTESRLVDDLLDLALSTTSELAIHPRLIDPITSVRTAIESLQPSSEAHRVALVAKLEPGTQILADPRRLEQIVLELLANALEFTPPSGNVHVSLDEANGALALRVSDTGRGIAPDFLPLVFEPFSQQDRSSTRAHRGLGIGLALVRHLVERQGGTIEVASSEGSGTTFTVRFPVTSRA